MSQADRPSGKLNPGDVIDEFSVTEQINTRGGFAAVFKGEEILSGRPVIIKLMNDGLGELEQSFFRNEARFLGESVGHPNIVELLHHGQVSGSPYLVIELLDTELTARLP
jgi:serine/threonine protein kinase